MGIWIQTLKGKAASLKKEVTAIYYAYQNRGIGIMPKIMIGITLGYALSPIDLIPDFIPVLGYLDDLIVLPLLITITLRLIPNDIMDNSREKALKQPIKFRNNWSFAILIIIVWIILIVLILIVFLPNAVEGA